MNDDTEALKRIENILRTDDLSEGLEVVGLALSLHDEEEQCLSLLNITRWLVERDDWQKALGAAQLMPESYEKCEALRSVGEKLGKIGHIEKAFTALADAETAATGGTLEEWQQAELLHSVAKSLRTMNAIFKANEVWQKAIEIAQRGQESVSPQDAHDCASVLFEIADYFAEAGLADKAVQTAARIQYSHLPEQYEAKMFLYSQQVRQVA